MTARRKRALVLVLAAVLAGHAALFAAGGSWRRLGMILVGVDVVSAGLVAGALREFRKLDREDSGPRS
jgi:hypothetical protein